MDVTIRSKNIDNKLNNRAYEGVDSIIHQTDYKSIVFKHEKANYAC